MVTDSAYFISAEFNLDYVRIAADRNCPKLKWLLCLRCCLN